MSKRNFILLIIVLILIVIGILSFFFFRSSTPGGPTNGTNFISIFNPFGTGGKTPTGTTTPPTNVTGYVPPTTQVASEKLKKVSNMPIAGYIVYNKERLKAVPPAPTPGTDTTTTTVTAGTIGATTTPTSTTTASGGTLPKTVAKNSKTTKTPAPLTEFVSSLKYVARATGNIYETFADTISEKKFSATVIPQIYEATFGNGGDSVALRYLKSDDPSTIESFVGTTPKEYLGSSVDGTAELKGAFLPENVQSISLSPDTSNIFYLFNTENSIIGTTMNLASSKKLQIFTSPFTEWLSFWPNSKMITFTTKPASGIVGYMYALNPSSTVLNKVLGDINGLTTLTSPDGKMVLYGDDNLSLNVYHTDTNTSNTLGVKTLPEKCVWNKLGDTVYCLVPKSINPGQYPDSWYQGEVSFADQIWKIDIKTGNATLLLDPLSIIGGEDVDGIKLALDDGENYLFFVNKKDSFLWEFNLK